MDRREREAIAYLIEENRLLRRQLGGRRLRLTDDDRRWLAARAYRVGRAALREIATIATPDTLLRWHRPRCSLPRDSRRAVYRDRFGWQSQDYPHAQRIGRQTASVPLSSRMTRQDVSYVIVAAEKVCSDA